MPTECMEVEIDGQFSAEDFAKIRQGFIPQSSDQKWFIYFADGWLNFHRAQSGSCIFKLEIVQKDASIYANHLLVNQAKEQYRSISQAYDVELLAYLIDHYLLGRAVPFPQPKRLNKAHWQTNQAHVEGKQNPGSADNFIRIDSISK